MLQHQANYHIYSQKTLPNPPLVNTDIYICVHRNKYVLDIETLSLYKHGSRSTSIPAPDSKEIISLFHPHPEAIAEALSNIQRVCIIMDDHSREIDTEIKDLKMMKEEHDSHSTKLRNLDALCHSIAELQSKMIEELQSKALLSNSISPILPNGSLNNQIRTARQLSTPASQPFPPVHSLPPSSKPISRLPNSSDFTFHDPSARSLSPSPGTGLQEPQFPAESSTKPLASQEHIPTTQVATDDIVPRVSEKPASVDSNSQPDGLQKRGRRKRKASEVGPEDLENPPVKRKPGRPSNRSRATTADDHIPEANKSRESTARLKETPISKAPVINIEKPDAPFKAIISSPSQAKNSGSILDKSTGNRHTPSERDTDDTNPSRGRKPYRAAHHSK